MHIGFYEGKVIGVLGDKAIPFLAVAGDGETIRRTDTQLCQNRKHAVDVHDEIGIKVLIAFVNAQQLLDGGQNTFGHLHGTTPPYLLRAMYFLMQKPSAPEAVQTL